MVLSQADNPLTAPIVAPQGKEPRDPALERFTVRGNTIITGGAGVLGLSNARALLEHGSSAVCLFDLATSLLSSAQAIEGLKRDFPNAKVFTEELDVTDENNVREAVSRCHSAMGSVDILLCFAGIVGSKHSVDVHADEWRRIVDINLTGSWFTAQAVGKKMIDQGSGGSIMFTASFSAHRVNFPQPQVAYNASKGALLQLKSSLAAEWARYGIRVNSISPGYMDTILNEGPGLDAVKEQWYARNPMGRMGDPTELNGVVILLCSNAGRYITSTRSNLCVYVHAHRCSASIETCQCRERRAGATL